MTPEQIVRTFVDHFHRRGHRSAPESPLIPPPGDPVLFTTSGMHPLTPYLAGRPHPSGRRLVNVQRCLRTTDLDEVGDPTHLTVFDMLGTWSLGDYGIGPSLRWGYELLTDGFGVDPGRLHATVFGGDDQVGPDETALATWTELGVPVELTRAENWWSNGPTGPCGPDSEIFVWTGDGPPTGTPAATTGGWRSGTTCGCATTGTTTAGWSRCRSPTSTPGWAWSGWRWCCAAAGRFSSAPA